MYAHCKNCLNEGYHELLEHIITRNNIFIESRCKNCSAVTSTRYKTEVLYQKVFFQPKLQFVEEEQPADIC